MHVDRSYEKAPNSAPREVNSLPAPLDAISQELSVTTGGFAALVGTSANHITDRARTGVLRPLGRNRFLVVENVRLYCDDLRAAAGRHGAGKRHPGKERLVEAQARLAELKLAATEGRLLAADAVERQWGDALRRVRAEMLAVPSRFAARVGLTAIDAAALDAEIRAALESLADRPHGESTVETDAPIYAELELI